jgi:hypothetical protein
MTELKHVLQKNTTMFVNFVCNLARMAMTRGERITHAMTESGLDVPAIAKGCNVSVQSVYGWRSDETKDIKLINFFKLATLTNFEARWIAFGEGPERSPYRNKYIASVVAMMGNMPEIVQAEAHAVVERVAAFAVRLVPDQSLAPIPEPYPGDRRELGDRRLQMGQHKDGDTFQMLAVSLPPPKTPPENGAGKRKK